MTWKRSRLRHEFPQKTIDAIFVRAGGPNDLHCECCGKLLRRGDAWEIDHKTECWEGGEGTLENGWLLGVKCCHRSKSAKKSGRRAKCDRVARKDMGLKPKSKRPMRGGRGDTIKFCCDGSVVDRETGEVIAVRASKLQQ